MTQLIYCADGNRHYAEIAIRHGFTYGAQLPNTVYYPPQFVDQNWKVPDREKYMKSLAEHKPALATVLDWEREDQLEDVLSWAWEASQHVSEAVIIIPKVMSGINRLPRTIAGKQVRLGFSIPTAFGGTSVPIWEFTGWPVHALGGSPQEQMKLAAYLNVVSADGNYAAKISHEFCKYLHAGKWRSLKNDYGIVIDGPYVAFELSCINIRAAWSGCAAGIRYATESDLQQVKEIANQYKNELGFVMLPALHKAIEKRELYVAEYGRRIVGFCNWHRRRDGIHTIYEIAVHRDFKRQRIGNALLNAVPHPKQLKCTTDNPANQFYEASGLQLFGSEQGRKRTLNAWKTSDNRK